MDDQLIESLDEVAGGHTYLLDDVATRVRAHLRLSSWRLGRSIQKRTPRIDIGANRDPGVPANLISPDPIIILALVGGVRPLWTIEAFGRRLPTHKVTFLCQISWSAEIESEAKRFHKHAEEYRAMFPNHRLLFLCNTVREEQLFRQTGEDAHFMHQNAKVSENIFKPLDGSDIRYDAIYNAKLARFKRHYLSFDTPRVAHVTYVDRLDLPRSKSAALCRRIQAVGVGHNILNPLVNGLPEMMAPEEVNRAYNSAAVGLCLSPVEGGMYASAEYLLSGLPIVTTPNEGGRDYYFDDEYCLQVNPNPRSIRLGVERIRQDCPGRDEIRARTLARILDDRDNFRARLASALQFTSADLSQFDCWTNLMPTSQPVSAHLQPLF